MSANRSVRPAEGRETHRDGGFLSPRAAGPRAQAADAQTADAPPADARAQVDRAQAARASRIERDLALTRSLRMNRGVISVAGLQRLGYTEREVSGLMGHGQLRRLYRGVYADGRTPLFDDAALAAALLAVGPQSWLAGRTAAMACGLEPVSLSRLEVGTVAGGTPSHPGLTVHRSSNRPHHSELVVRRGLRMSSVPRLLIEAAGAGASQDVIQTLTESAVRRGLLQSHDLAATLARNAGRRGVGRVRVACGDYLPHAGRRSWLEHSFDRWLRRHPEIVEPRRNIRMGPWEVDCLWPEHGLALELDGRAYHIAVGDFERDRRKDAWLQGRGLRVLRISEHRWRTDRRGAQEDLITLLSLGHQVAS